ncbi:AAA family ATPase [Streptomyces sp. NBC_01317]|uniref:RNA ligase family protein n=1 Tax=Streptomyces sp. NBC_01317 TaxID=2903822 RepID=UPI002E15E879|nr:AAA family ATPase [Streptomyces sp. NBC_01317]
MAATRRVHYPRTPHLPWSPGATPDDVRTAGLSGLRDREVVVTEKLDGENTTLYADGLHARSPDSAHHPSRAWVKGLQGRIGAGIPPGWRVCGENLFARHSIAYTELESWFYGFSVWDGERCLDWDRTVPFLRRLGIPVPPVLWRGVLDERAVRALRALRLDAARQEGYVVRTVEGFAREEFGRRAAKWVRPGHVRTDSHWMYAEVVENSLGPAAALWAVRSGAPPHVAALAAGVGVKVEVELSGGATSEGSAAGAGATRPAATGVADSAGSATTGGARSAATASARPATAEATHSATARTAHRAETTASAGGAHPTAVEVAQSASARAAQAAHRTTAEAALTALSPEALVADVSARLDVLGRSGDARLAGVLAALLHDHRRSWLVPQLAGTLGMPLARRIADLVGLHTRLHRPHPDDERRTGLGHLALAADLGVLHAVAGAVAVGRGAEAREQVDWSALHAEEAGLLGEAPLEPLRPGLRDALAGLGDPDAADRCWAEAREAYATGRVTSADAATAATWRWRNGDFPRLIHLVGPSGSGKSTFAARLPGVDTRVSLDDLRQARGSRADQRANADVLREGLRRLDTALAAGRTTVVWDATSLSRHQRSLVHAVARRRDALITRVVVLVGEEELVRRNATRAHPVPPEVLAGQLHRFDPPYPGEAHRTWYVGQTGTVEDTDGGLNEDGTSAGYGSASGTRAPVGGAPAGNAPARNET